MRAAVRIDAGLSPEGRSVAGISGEDGRIAKERGILNAACELGAELTEGEELGAVLDEAEGSDIPECRRAAIAEDDLVAVGEGEE